MHCLNPDKSIRCAVPKQVQKWAPPSSGLVCVNVAVVVFSSSSSSASGLVT